MRALQFLANDKGGRMAFVTAPWSDPQTYMFVYDHAFTDMNARAIGMARESSSEHRFMIEGTHWVGIKNRSGTPRLLVQHG